MCARLWPVGRPASRPRARPVEATHEGSLQLHTRHHIVDRGAGGTVSRSIRERFPGTRRGSLHDYEGSRFSGGGRPVLLRIAVPFSGTQTRIHFCNGALRRRPPTQLPHSVRTCATSSHLAHAPPHHGLGHISYPFGGYISYRIRILMYLACILKDTRILMYPDVSQT